MLIEINRLIGGSLFLFTILFACVLDIITQSNLFIDIYFITMGVICSYEIIRVSYDIRIKYRYYSILQKRIISSFFTISSFLLFITFIFLEIYQATIISIIFLYSIKRLINQYTLIMFSYILFGIGIAISINDMKIIGLCIICSCVNDTCAYIFGKSFGSIKISSVSPNKTLEGLIFGFTSAFIISGLYMYIVYPMSSFNAVITTSLLGPILCILGDLICSFYKRISGIKDYSSLIPGHGGVLDRFDSIIAIFLLGYFFQSLLS